MRTRTRCPGCEQVVAAGQELTEVKGTGRGYGTSPSGKTYLREVPVTVRWHTACVREFEAQREASMEDVAVQNLAGLYRAMVPGTVTREQFVAMGRKAGHEDARIERAIKEASA